MSTISIRNKIWISFGLLAVLLITVGVTANNSLKQNSMKLSSLVNEVQPAVVKSLELVGQLDSASASIGFYLLSKEKIHKKEYLANLKKISDSTRQLVEMPVIVNDKATFKLVKEIEAKTKKLESYKTKMILYAENQAENVTAMKMAAVELNPRAQSLFQYLQEMIESEKSETASPLRRNVLLNVYSLRTNLASVVNELRVFLAFRTKEAVENFTTYAELLGNDTNKLNKFTEDELTFEQSDALENFNAIYKVYITLAAKVMKIHGREDYRLDAYVIRKELSPLILEIKNNLNTLVTEKYQQSINDSELLTDQVEETQTLVSSLIGGGLIAAIIIGLMLSRAITNPIDSLKDSAKELANGHLDHEIDTSRNDELGSLAKSFADMRDSIRKKIGDLRVLNNTGEELTGLHSQIKALQTALKVMGEQTNVEWGSVYLFNKDNNKLEISAFYPEHAKKEKGGAKSFNLGEGVAGMAAEQNKVFFVPDTSKDDNFIGGEYEENARAIVSVPMRDGDEVFGVMNFCGEVGQVTFEDADAEFAETISRMTVVASKNIQMLNVIEEQNRTLEEKITERTAELATKTNDINSMLQNMHQGIFTICRGIDVHPEYSAYLEEIMETNKVAKEDAVSFLFGDSDVGSNDHDQFTAAMGAIMGEDAMMFDFNKHCLIAEYSKKMKDGREKILELDWDPIVNKDDVVEKLMVTVRDVTALRGLQKEAEAQKWELEIIGQILAVSAPKFEGFVESAMEYIKENREIITIMEKNDPNVVATLFRNMHTIKGNARTYAFAGITDVVHEAESTYDRMRKGEMDLVKEKLFKELDDVTESIGVYERIYSEKLSINQPEGIFIDSQLAQFAMETILNIDTSKQKSMHDGVNKIKMVVKAVGTDTLQSTLDGIVQSMPDLAMNLGKEPPDINIQDHHIRLEGEVSNILKDVFTHCFRNSIDHGIESVEQRESVGKPSKGSITLDAEQTDGHLVFRLYDDGQGLPLEKIKEKAIKAGLIKEKQKISDIKIANMIFNSGLSTAESVSDVSGRGVGMDAVRQFLQKIGGYIDIKFTSERSGENGYRAIEFVITLPDEHYVKVA